MKSEKHFGLVELSVVEVYIGWFLWLPLALYPIYVAYVVSNRYKDQIPEDYMVSKWFSKKQDISDYEWTFWKDLVVYFALTLIIYSLVSSLVRNVTPCHERKIQTVTSVIIIAYIVSFSGLLLTIFHTILFFAILSLKGRTLMWFYTLCMLYGLHKESVKEFQFKLFIVNENVQDLFEFSTLMCYLRMISYGTYVIDKNEKQCYSVKTNPESHSNFKVSSLENLTDFFHYVFYYPLFFNGPVLTYDRFTLQWSNRVKLNIKFILFDTFTSISYFLILESMFHIFYVPAISKLQYILEELSPMESIGVVWTELQIFLLKYIVFYRFVGIFAKIDGLVPPSAPKCISSLYTFKDMWRNFDKGLHQLLYQSIYIPIGGSRYGLKWEMLATFFCFSFVAFWHGNSYSLWVWGLSNFLGIILEKALALFMNTKYGLRITNGISLEMYRRLCAFCGAFSVYFLIYTNIIFLFEFNSATILFWNVFKNWYSPMLVILIVYFANQCTIEVH